MMKNVNSNFIINNLPQEMFATYMLSYVSCPKHAH